MCTTITLIIGPRGTRKLAEEMGLGTGAMYTVADLDRDTPKDVEKAILVGREHECDIFLVTRDPMEVTVDVESMLVDMGIGLNKGVDRRIVVKLSEKMLARTQGDEDEEH